MSDITVTRNDETSRYEASIDGRTAGFAQFRLDGSSVVFPHTVVDPEFEGRGVGSAIVRRSLDEAREQGRTVVPACSFYASWIERHPEYADLTA